MWRLAHRRLILLTQPWYADHHHKPPYCLLCQHQREETYSHLFSDCPLASHLWDSVHPLQQALRGVDAGDQRPARLIGDLSQFDLSWRTAVDWPDNTPVASEARFASLVREMWTEIRAVVLKTIWGGVRCDLLHGNLSINEEAGAHAFKRVQSSLRTLAYLKLPSLLPGAIRPRPRVLQGHLGDNCWTIDAS